MFRKKGARRVEVITNGLDPADCAPPRPSADLVLGYLGTFYPDRQDLSAVWTAIRGLRAEGVKARVLFVGDLPAATRDQLTAHEIGDAVDVTGFLPHRVALDRLSTASALVIAGSAGDPLLRGMIPAKIFEYLGSGLPILYVGDLSTDAAALLRGQPGCLLIGARDVAGARDALRTLMRPTTHARPLEAFHRRALAGRLGALLDEVVATSAR
jgi:glycosyltransferase involved in cell wall biosynthesis